MKKFENDLEKFVRLDLPIRFNEYDLLKTHFSRVINIFEGEILPPYEILIHSSSICNLNCEWCIGSFVANKKNCDKLLQNNLSKLENMKKVVDNILAYKKVGKNYLTGEEEVYSVQNVSFSGITGEPFMSKKSILYAIEKLSSNGIRVGAFTNGTLFDEDMYDVLLKMGYLLISIDAGTTETYSKLKCQGKDIGIFDKILISIEKLSERKKELSSKTDINVGYVVNQYNYNEIYTLAKKLKEIGVHYLRFKTDIASLMNMSDIERDKAKEQIELAKRELEDENFSIVEIHNVLSDRDKKRDFTKCFVHYLIANISADGNIYPCNYHPKPNGYYFGSAINENFEKIWDNLINNELDKKLPDICPSVCDPFKNRANRLLEAAYNIYCEKGLDYLIQCIEEIDKKINKENEK